MALADVEHVGALAAGHELQVGGRSGNRLLRRVAEQGAVDLADLAGRAVEDEGGVAVLAGDEVVARRDTSTVAVAASEAELTCTSVPRGEFVSQAVPSATCTVATALPVAWSPATTSVLPRTASTPRCTHVVADACTRIPPPRPSPVGRLSALRGAAREPKAPADHAATTSPV